MLMDIHIAKSEVCTYTVVDMDKVMVNVEVGCTNGLLYIVQVRPA